MVESWLGSLWLGRISRSHTRIPSWTLYGPIGKFIPPSYGSSTPRRWKSFGHVRSARWKNYLYRNVFKLLVHFKRLLALLNKHFEYWLAQLMKNSGMVFANDKNKLRTKALVANVHRLGCSNVVISNYDGRSFPTIMGGFDRVLLGKKCSWKHL